MRPRSLAPVDATISCWMSVAASSDSPVMAVTQLLPPG